ncbi:copper amine oxidase N-terminal domain-containing protein [Cohnella candidum]|nr:copper amine oxidase N-terminal domain-containing protein [Cohnella candidum]
MKRLSAIFITLMLVFAFAGQVSAAAPQEKQVHILLNGKELAFPSAPKIIENKTYVEYRSLLEQLGYEVEYAADSKTIQAQSAMHQIEMTVGADVAFVDGKTVPISGQLRIVGDGVWVGLRFVAELSGMEIKWNAKTYEAALVDNGPTPEQQAAVFKILDKMLLVEAASDPEGALKLFSEDSPLRAAGLGEELKKQMEKVKVRTTIVNKRIESYSATEAVLVTVEDSAKVSGGFYPEYRSQTRYTLHPGSDGEWLLYTLEPLGIEYTNVPALFDQAVTVPDAVKSDIGKLLDDQLKATQTENIEAYLATMTFKSDAEKEAFKGQLQQIFSAADSSPAVEKWIVVEYNGTDKATILWSLVSDVKVGTQAVKTKVVLANELEKVNGKWLFNSNQTQLSAKQL